jgi:DNA-binding transcriptional LysR family regulator
LPVSVRAGPSQPPTDPAEAARSRRLSDLADEEWIAGSARADETLLAPYLRADFNPRIGFVAKDWIAKQGFVAAGVGITLLPSLAAAAIRPDVTLVALDPQGIPPRQICTATVRGVTPTAATNASIEVLSHQKLMGGANTVVPQPQC